MRRGFASRRRAEEFDALVEGGPTGELHDARDADLLELVVAMRGVPEVSARPEFVADLRERLMAEAETALVPDDLDRLRLPSRRPKRERRMAALVGGIAIVGATTSVAVASQSALPGDSLYPVKRVLEEAHTSISIGEASKGQTVLSNASDRLDEVEALVQQDDPGNDQRIADTLNAFTDQATSGSDLLLADYNHHGNKSSIVRLHDFASSSLDRLAALEPLVPADARDELLRAADVLATIDTQAGQRCPSCGGTSIDSIPPVLAAGSEPIVVPQVPPVQPRDESDHRRHAPRADQVENPDLPDVDGDDLGPGSVQDPSSGSSPSASPSDDGDGGGSNPLTDLTDKLTGRDNPSGSPTRGVVGGLVNGVGELLGGVLGGLTGQNNQP